MNIKGYLFYENRLVRLCGVVFFIILIATVRCVAAAEKSVPVLTFDSGKIYLSVPADGRLYELCITAQIDSGMGLVDYGLQAQGPFLLRSDKSEGIVVKHVLALNEKMQNRVSSLWQTKAMLNQNALSLSSKSSKDWDATFVEGQARVDLTSRLLTGEGLYKIGHSDLEQEDNSQARLLSVRPCAKGYLVRMRRYFYHLPKANTDESLKMSGLLPVDLSLYLTCVPYTDRSASIHEKVWFMSPRFSASVRGLVEKAFAHLELCSAVQKSFIVDSAALACDPLAFSYDVSARDVCLQTSSNGTFIRLLVPGAFSTDKVISTMIREGYGLVCLPDWNVAYRTAADSLLLGQLIDSLRLVMCDKTVLECVSPRRIAVSPLTCADSLFRLYLERAEKCMNTLRTVTVHESSVTTPNFVGNVLYDSWLLDVGIPLVETLMSSTDNRQTRLLADVLFDQQCRLLQFLSEANPLLIERVELLRKSRALWDILWQVDSWKDRYKKLASGTVQVRRDPLLISLGHRLNHRYSRDIENIVRQSCVESAVALTEKLKQESDAEIGVTFAYLLLQKWSGHYVDKLINRN